MPARHNTLSSRSSGFVPLGPDTSTGIADNDIPLTTVRSNVSTGVRHANLSGDPDPTEAQNPAEKSGHHLHLRPAGRRRKTEEQGLDDSTRLAPEETRLNAMGRLYAKIVGFSFVTRYLVYVVPIAILLAVPLVLLPVTGNKDNIFVGSFRPNGSNELIQGPTLFTLFLWIEISWVSLWAAKIVAWLLPHIFMFFCGIVSKGVRKYATVLSNLSIPLSLFFWALATWLALRNLFLPALNRRVPWVVTIELVFGALFVSSAVLLAEKALVQLIGVSYHQRSFANRIKASKREVYLLGVLFDASRTLFPMYCREFAQEDYVINDSIQMILARKARRKNAAAAAPMKIIGDVGRLGDKVTSAFGNIAHEITGKQVFNPNSAHSVVVEALEKRRPSEALARRIWMSFVLEGRDSLSLEDFQEVLGPAYREEAEEAFHAIDSDANGDVSLDEMVRKVAEIGKERKAITEGMKDIGQALRVFDKVLLFVVLLIVIFIFLAFFRSSFVSVIAAAGTTLLSLSFVFAVTTQEFLGSCIFLFVKHPYDVGDRVDITGIPMMVDRISLLYTVFTRLEQMQVVQVPNIQLNNLWIDNISRSKSMVENIELEIAYETTFEDIELLSEEMEKFVRSPENSRDFQPDFSIGIGGVGSLDKLLLQISIKHKSNLHDDAVRITRRSKFMCALAVALKKIPIYGPGLGFEVLGGPTNPTYTVTVDNDFAVAARKEADKKKEEARLVPTPGHQTKEEALAMEQQAIIELNSRPVAADASGAWNFGEDRVRDDRSIISRVASQDGRHSRGDVRSIRSGLFHRESQHGRRRAGEGLQRAHLMEGGLGGEELARASSRRLSRFDEEAQTGITPAQHGAEDEADHDVGVAIGDEQRLQPSAPQHGPHRGRSLAHRDLQARPFGRG